MKESSFTLSSPLMDRMGGASVFRCLLLAYTAVISNIIYAISQNSNGTLGHYSEFCLAASFISMQRYLYFESNYTQKENMKSAAFAGLFLLIIFGTGTAWAFFMGNICLVISTRNEDENDIIKTFRIVTLAGLAIAISSIYSCTFDALCINLGTAFIIYFTHEKYYFYDPFGENVHSRTNLMIVLCIAVVQVPLFFSTENITTVLSNGTCAFGVMEAYDFMFLPYIGIICLMSVILKHTDPFEEISQGENGRVKAAFVTMIGLAVLMDVISFHLDGYSFDNITFFVTLVIFPLTFMGYIVGTDYTLHRVTPKAQTTIEWHIRGVEVGKMDINQELVTHYHNMAASSFFSIRNVIVFSTIIGPMYHLTYGDANFSIDVTECLTVSNLFQVSFENPCAAIKIPFFDFFTTNTEQSYAWVFRIIFAITGFFIIRRLVILHKYRMSLIGGGIKVVEVTFPEKLTLMTLLIVYLIVEGLVIDAFRQFTECPYTTPGNSEYLSQPPGSSTIGCYAFTKNSEVPLNAEASCYCFNKNLMELTGFYTTALYYLPILTVIWFELRNPTIRLLNEKDMIFMLEHGHRLNYELEVGEGLRNLVIVRLFFRWMGKKKHPAVIVQAILNFFREKKALKEFEPSQFTVFEEKLPTKWETRIEKLQNSTVAFIVVVLAILLIGLALNL